MAGDTAGAGGTPQGPTRLVQTVWKLGAWHVAPGDAAALCAWVVALGTYPSTWDTVGPLSVATAWSQPLPVGSTNRRGVIELTSDAAWVFGWPLALFRTDALTPAGEAAAPRPRCILVSRTVELDVNGVMATPRGSRMVAVLDGVEGFRAATGQQGAWAAWLASPEFWPAFLAAELAAARGGATPGGAPVKPKMSARGAR